MLLTYRNKFVAIFEPGQVESGQRTLRQTHLNDPGSLHARSHDRESNPSTQSNGFQSRLLVFPVIQQRSQFSSTVASTRMLTRFAASLSKT